MKFDLNLVLNVLIALAIFKVIDHMIIEKHIDKIPQF
jgi:hypothetical protein